MMLNVDGVINLIANGMSVNKIADLTTITQSGFKKKIKKMGFVYQDKAWVYTGLTDEKTLEKEVAELTYDGTKVYSEVIHGEITDYPTELNEQERDNRFTIDEFKTLKSMITYFESHKAVPTGKRVDVIDSLDKFEVGTLSNRKRTSYNVSTDVIEKLEGFSKRMRISQSDLVELALLELLHSYDHKIK